MANLKDRVKREVSPTESAILNIAGKKAVKEKYPVNVVFDGKNEAIIRKAAEVTGVGVATFIKIAVKEKLTQMGLDQE